MRHVSSAVLMVAAVLLSPASRTAAMATPVRPRPQIEHVVILIVDGLRPDCALLADTPTIHAMARTGAYTFWARTTSVAITLPSCTSMLTGVSPAKHHVDWNRDLPAGKQAYPAVPTVLEMATRAGYDTALVAGKSKFVALAPSGAVTHVFLPAAGGKCSDEEVAAEAAKIITAFRPALMCIHFPDVDVVGHAKGWGSPEQLAQIARTDRAIEQVFAALERAGMRGSTVVVLSADHGGAGRTHGGEDPRSRHSPWVAVGPGVRPGYDLTQNVRIEVRTEDTGATACWLLGLPLPPYLDGQPVRDAFAPGS